jgi:hypothetical protein
VLQARSAEVQDERPLEAGCPQVIDCLRFLDASKQLQRFDLGDHFIEADEVRTVRCGEDPAPDEIGSDTSLRKGIPRQRSSMA